MADLLEFMSPCIITNTALVIFASNISWFSSFDNKTKLILFIVKITLLLLKAGIRTIVDDIPEEVEIQIARNKSHTKLVDNQHDEQSELDEVIEGGHL